MDVQDPDAMATDVKWLKWVEAQFKEVAGEDQIIDPDEFKRTLKVKKSFLSDRFFRLLDKDDSGSLTLHEVMDGLQILVRGSQRQKLKFLFDVYDINGNGTLEYDELREALHSCMDESSVTLSTKDTDRLADLLFDACDIDETGVVTFREFYEVLETQYPSILENLTLSVATWLQPGGKSSRANKFRVCSWHYVTHNVPLVGFVLAFLSLNLAMFVGVIVKHLLAGQNGFYAVARGSGMCLNFDSAFVLVFMLRLTLSWVRSSPVGMYLPMDSSVFLHRMVGFSIAFHALVHTVGHMGHIAWNIDLVAERTLGVEAGTLQDFRQTTPLLVANTKSPKSQTSFDLPDINTSIPEHTFARSKRDVLHTRVTNYVKRSAGDDVIGSTAGSSPSPSNVTIVQWSQVQRLKAAALWIFTLDSEIGWLISGFAYISGVLLDVILIIMVICSLSCVRRSGHFEVFYWTHFLYLPFWVITFLHGPIFYYFFAIPGIIFIIEKIYLSPPIRLARLGKTYITKANLLPSKVTHLVISRPENFWYKPGDYIFINIPEIALYEWHPFTISSAPEMQSEIWVHIRSEGHWTTQLYRYIEERGGELGRVRGDSSYDILDAGHFTSGLFSKNNTLRAIHKKASQLSLTSKKNGGPEDDIKCISMKRKNDGTQSENDVILQVVDEASPKSSTSSADHGPRTPVTPKSPKPITFETQMSSRSQFSRSSRPRSVHNMKTFTDLNIKVDVQGPFGTATRDIFDQEHAVLVAAGIGVTPYAAILQSIMYRYIASKKTCPKCQYAWYEHIPDHVMKLKRVDFIWINRDQKSFEWFLSMLTQLEKQQTEVGEDFLQMQLYMTSAASESDIKGLCLQMALDLMRNKEDKDMLTGLRTKTRSGRPDWNKVFQDIDANKRGNVKVFFCGSRQIAKIVRQKCMEYRFSFSKEQF